MRHSPPRGLQIQGDVIGQNFVADFDGQKRQFAQQIQTPKPDLAESPVFIRLKRSQISACQPRRMRHGLAVQDVERGAAASVLLDEARSALPVWMLTIGNGIHGLEPRQAIRSIQRHVEYTGRLLKSAGHEPHGFYVIECQAGLHAHVVFAAPKAIATKVFERAVKLGHAETSGALRKIYTTVQHLFRAYLAKEVEVQTKAKFGNQIGKRRKGSKKVAGFEIGDRVRMFAATRKELIGRGWIEPETRQNMRRVKSVPNRKSKSKRGRASGKQVGQSVQPAGKSQTAPEGVSLSPIRGSIQGKHQTHCIHTHKHREGSIPVHTVIAGQSKLNRAKLISIRMFACVTPVPVKASQGDGLKINAHERQTMSKKRLITEGQFRFAKAIAEGKTDLDAYSTAYAAPEMSAQSKARAGRRLRQHVLVKKAVADWESFLAGKKRAEPRLESYAVHTRTRADKAHAASKRGLKRIAATSAKIAAKHLPGHQTAAETLDAITGIELVGQWDARVRAMIDNGQALVAATVEQLAEELRFAFTMALDNEKPAEALAIAVAFIELLGLVLPTISIKVQGRTGGAILRLGGMTGNAEIDGFYNAIEGWSRFEDGHEPDLYGDAIEFDKAVDPVFVDMTDSKGSLSRIEARAMLLAVRNEASRMKLAGVIGRTITAQARLDGLLQSHIAVIAPVLHFTFVNGPSGSVMTTLPELQSAVKAENERRALIRQEAERGTVIEGEPVNQAGQSVTESIAVRDTFPSRKRNRSAVTAGW